MAASAHALPSGAAAPGAKRRFGGLMLSSIGVVFGDIGTSPIYGFKTAITQAARGAVGQAEVFGVISLTVWALILVVMIKYVSFIMRADNKGEGGILSLMALAQGAIGSRTRLVLGLGICGAALFYGDAVITPAISVLSAVEGLKTSPGLAPVITPGVEIAITLAVLVALFSVQSHGTGKVSALFGPICLVWFIVIATLGVLHIPDAPEILLAINPVHGALFLAKHGLIGLFVLGSVSLTVTGAEALYAAMGHFGRAPIRAAWMAVVFPALILNYLGQGAFALHALSTAAGHAAAVKDQNWFFLMAPPVMRLPLVLLATAATIIASQAVISGAYSLSGQAMQLGLLPRLEIRQTSAIHAGQIYVPTINMLLMLGVILLVGIFKNSESIANAYGLAVTGTMLVDTALASVVVRRLWRWPDWKAALLIGPLAVVDIALLGANSLKLFSGGFAPLAIAGGIALIIVTWLHGSAIVGEKSRRDRIPLSNFLVALSRRPRHMVAGTAVYMTNDPELTPGALLHNLKHNGVLHEHNVLVTVRTTDQPRVADADRSTTEVLNPAFLRIILCFGYMEAPDVPLALSKLSGTDVAFDPMNTSYFLGRRTIVSGERGGLQRLQGLLFMALARNSSDPSNVFAIPPGRVLEMGTQVTI
jgi:KUP system potassium uptake protein